MRICLVVFVAIFMHTHVVYAQKNCTTVVECAQAAVEAAQTAQLTTDRLRDELKTLQETVNSQEQLNNRTRTAFQTLISNGNIQPSTGAEVVSVGSGITQIKCGNGEYLVGVSFHWTGTCRNQCDGDGPILRLVAPICRKF